MTAEMDAADIAVGVMVARSTPSVHIDNDDVATVAKDSNGRLLGVASVDPSAVGVQNALKELNRSASTLGLIGLNIDAGFYKVPIRADDPTLMPLYDACQGLKLP